MDKQPAALVIARYLEEGVVEFGFNLKAADELRRLHHANQELVDALSMVLDDPQALDGRPRTYEYVCEVLAKHKETSMTDKELLELAAKAAGIEVAWDESTECFWTTDGYDSFVPLTYDADALRLVVTLGIDLEWRNDGRVAAYRHANANGHCFTAVESIREEKYAATRRAIVRAAAEIGKSMGEQND